MGTLVQKTTDLLHSQSVTISALVDTKHQTFLMWKMKETMVTVEIETMVTVENWCRSKMITMCSVNEYSDILGVYFKAIYLVLQ